MIRDISNEIVVNLKDRLRDVRHLIAHAVHADVFSIHGNLLARRRYFVGPVPAATGLRSNGPLLSTRNTQSEALSQVVVWR